MSRATTQISQGQISVSSTATQVVAARPGRAKLYLAPLAGTWVFGADSTVTLSTGVPSSILAGPSGTSPIELDTQAAVWAISDVNGATVGFLELHD